MTIEELKDYQARNDWTDETMLTLAFEFMAEEGIVAKFASMLEEIQTSENEQATLLGLDA